MLIDEEVLEGAFWAFDEERRRTGAERDAFKHKTRLLLRAHARSWQRLLEAAEIYVRAYRLDVEPPGGRHQATEVLRRVAAWLRENTSTEEVPRG